MSELMQGWSYLSFYLAMLAALAGVVWCKKLYVLNANRALYQEPLFWCAALTPVATGLYFGAIVWIPPDLQMDQEGFKNFLEISKLPLGMMALGIPFGVVVGSFHRTLQTAEQIKQAESSNNFKNYVEHKKDFIDKIKLNVPYIQASDYHAAFAYQFFFPHGKKGDFSISKDAEKFITFVVSIGSDLKPLSYFQNEIEINDFAGQDIYKVKQNKLRELEIKVSEIHMMLGFSAPDDKDNFIMDEACNGIISCFEAAVSCIDEEKDLISYLGMSDIRLLCFNDAEQKGVDLMIFVKKGLDTIHGEGFSSRKKLNDLFKNVGGVFLRKGEYDYLYGEYKKLTKQSRSLG